MGDQHNSLEKSKLFNLRRFVLTPFFWKYINIIPLWFVFSYSSHVCVLDAKEDRDRSLFMDCCENKHLFTFQNN